MDAPPRLGGRRSQKPPRALRPCHYHRYCCMLRIRRPKRLQVGSHPLSAREGDDSLDGEQRPGASLGPDPLRREPTRRRGQGLFGQPMAATWSIRAVDASAWRSVDGAYTARQEGAYQDWGQHKSKADKVVITRFNAPNGKRRDNMHEWGPWRCYSWGVCTTDGNYDGCDARNLCCNSHAVRSFFNNAIDSVKQPLRGKFQAARHKALVLLGESVACPAGYSQQGYLGAAK